jgi:ectoine hydroxylase-related dioxygenase (phytanoyl-CoA dioxygenase family)
MTTVNATNLKQRYDDQGYVILKGVVDQSVLEGVRRSLTWLVNVHAGRLIEDGLIEDPCIGEPFETRLLKLYGHCLDRAPDSFRAELHLPGIYPLFFNDAVLDLAEAILGPEVRLYPVYTARPKLPDHEKSLVLWHQDAGYTAAGKAAKNHPSGLTVADLRMVNVWSPLVPARPENGCMQFIPGTHKLGVVDHVNRKYYMEIVESEINSRLDQVIDVVCDPGDVVLFSDLLFHRGQPNRAQMVRWSLDWRYQDATQPTLLLQNGHMARSRSHPDSVVRDAEHWTTLMLS